MAQAFLIALHRTNNQAANNPQRFVNAQVIRTSHALNAHFLIPKRSGFGCKKITHFYPQATSYGPNLPPIYFVE